MQTFSPIAVIRVLSDANKDEVACVALAAGTLYEEGSFFTVLHNQDINSNRDIFERDLQILYPLLNNRVWFGFDVELAAKTLERLYRSINQSPPQSLNHWDACQLFESTFSHSCNSLASAAQYLQIVPWNKRSVNARTECDVTCEILSRIALNCTVRQLGTPNQNISSLSPTDPTNENPEIMENRTKTVETQTQPHTHTHAHAHPHTHHTHTHSPTHTHAHAHAHAHPHTHTHTHTHTATHETTSYETQHPMSTNEDEKGGPEMTLNEQLDHKGHHHDYHTQTYNINDMTTSNIDTDQSFSQQIDTNTIRDRDTDNKILETSADNNTGLSHPTETQSNFSHQNQRTTDFGHSNRTNEPKRDDNVERDLFVEEHESDQVDTRNMNEDSATRHEEHGKAARSGPTSWKDLAKGKGATISPSRTSQLHIVPGMRNKGTPQGKLKPLQPTRDPQTIKQYITNAMETDRVIWISYDGGNQPLIPRGVKPTRWDDHPGTELAFLGVPFRSKTGKASKFFLRQVKEIRDRVWSRPEDAKFANRSNTNKEERGNKEKSEEKGLTDPSINSKTGYNNNNTDNTQSSKQPQAKKTPNKRT